MGQIIYPYTDGANYIYDNTKIEVADGVARLVQNTATGLDPTFAWKLNESSYSGQAGEISDASGNGNTGHSLTSETLVAGKYGNAVESPQLKSDNVITLGSGNGSFTLSWWMKARASIAVPHRLVLQYSSSGSPFYIYVGSIDHAQFTVNDAGNTSRTAYFDLTDFYDDTWHHFIWSVDVSDWTFRIYKDGVLFDSHTFNISTDRKADSTALQFGTKDGAQNFNGIMDEIIGFGRLLTDEEISTLYNNEYTGGNGALYPTDKPAIITNNVETLSNPKYKSFVEILGQNNAGSVGYHISEDGTNWYYWNGSAWVAAGTEYNTAAEVNEGIPHFSSSTGRIYVKAALISDGSQQVELDQLTIDYAFESAYNVGNTAQVIQLGTKNAGNKAAVEFHSSEREGNTAYIGDKTADKRGNKVYVEQEVGEHIGNEAFVLIEGLQKAFNMANVVFDTIKTAGNNANVATGEAKVAENKANVLVGVSEHIGNSAAVSLSGEKPLGNKAEIVLQKPIGNTASIVVVPTFYELRDFEIFGTIEGHISMKGDGLMEIIKGAKEYIYLRLKDKFGKIPDIAAGWVSFYLLDANGDAVIDSAAVERVEYSDEEESGFVYRYLLDTETIPEGDYNAVFYIENGEELIIRRASVKIVK